MPTIKLSTTVTAEETTIPPIPAIMQSFPVEDVRTPKIWVSHEAPGCKTRKRVDIGPKDQLKVLILVPKKVGGEEKKASGSETSRVTSAPKADESAKTDGAGFCHKLSFSTCDADGNSTGELPLDDQPRIFTDSALASLFGEGQTEIKCITFYNRTECDYDVQCIIGLDLGCPESQPPCGN